MGIKSIQSYEKELFHTVTFILYFLTALVCLLVYTMFFLKVFKSDSPGKKCCDPMRFGYTILIIVGMPLLANLVLLLDSTVDLIGYFQGEDLACSFSIEVILGIAIVISLSIVTFF